MRSQVIPEEEGAHETPIGYYSFDSISCGDGFGDGSWNMSHGERVGATIQPSEEWSW